MENVNFKRNEMYQDFDAALFFQQDFVNANYSKKLVKVNDEPVILVHVRATRNDGLIVETDIWPRNEATEEDIAAINTPLTDFEFRIGYYADPETGEVHTGAPKHLLCHGEKREYRG